MAPLRRYLRISPYSVLETRIYLEDPYANSWLLNSQNDVLQRIITAVKPFVFRQLRDEKERAQSRSKKRKTLKDTAIKDDFEVAVYLMDGITPHTLMVKQKGFGSARKKIKSNASNMKDWLDGSKERPMELVDADNVRVREEDDGRPSLSEFPASNSYTALVDVDEGMSEDEGFARTQVGSEYTAAEDDSDDKKKMGLNLSYDGFAIYGKVLCLVVKRRKGAGAAPNAGREMLATWVSTQAEQAPPMLDD